ncbi:MAG: tetratricopeptide repeat protein [Geitlerinemataceae cyanobacterium]
MKKSEWFYWESGKKLAEEKKWKEAIATFQEGIQLYPNNEALYRELGIVQEKIGDSEGEIESYRKAIELKRQQPDWVYVTLGYLLKQKGEEEDAILVYQSGLELYPDRKVLSDNLASIQTQITNRSQQLEPVEKEASFKQQVSLQTYLEKLESQILQEDSIEAISTGKEALELYPESADVYRWIGIAQEKIGEFEDELTSYQKAIKLDANQPNWVYLVVGRLLRERECLSEAIDTYRAALLLYPDDADIYRELGVINEELGHIEEQIENYSQAIKIDKKQPIWVYSQLANLLIQTERISEAIALCEEYLQLDGDCYEEHYKIFEIWLEHKSCSGGLQYIETVLEKNPEDKWSLVALGHICVQMEQFSRAIDSYQKALQLAPESAALHQYLANALRLRGKDDLRQALSSYRLAIQAKPKNLQTYHQALELDPHNVDAYVGLAEGLLSQEKPNGAIAFCQMALKLEHNRSDIYLKLGEALVSQKDYQPAISSLRRAIDLGESNPSVYYFLGFALDKSDRFDPALSAYQQAIEGGETRFECLLYLGLLLNRKSRFNDAVDIFRKAKRINPNDVALCEGLGRALGEQGNFEEALLLCQKAIQLQPERWSAHRVFGDVLRKQQRREEAVAAYQKATSLNPGFPWTYNSLGDTLRELGQWEAAEKAYTQFLELVPDRYWTYRNLATVLEKQEKWDRASTIYQKALELQPENSDLREKLEQIATKQQQQAQKSETYESYLGQAKKLNNDRQVNPAITNIQKAIDLQPDRPEAYHEMANILQQQGEWEDAIRYRIKTLEVCPIFKETYHRLMWTDWKEISSQRLEEAITSCRSALQHIQDVRLLPLIHSTIGDLLTKQGQLNEAIESYRVATYHKVSSQRSNSLFHEGWNWKKTAKNPDFFIIGGMRCGSTSLNLYLSQHPQVIAPLKKEIHFFGEHYQNGMNWYLSHFPPIPENQPLVTGEASPCLAEYGVWNRVAQWLPNIKLIAILRNPIDRAFSHYNHSIRWHSQYHDFESSISEDLQDDRMKSDSLDAAAVNQIVRSDYLKLGLYVHSLKEWMDLFPRENFLILQSEQFYADTVSTMSQVFEFLGLPDRSLSNYEHTNKGEYTSLKPSLRQALNDYFRPHNQKLEELLGMKFDWD